MVVRVKGIPKSLMALRGARHWSREQAAFELGVSSGSIIRWERANPHLPLRIHQSSVAAIRREYRDRFGTEAPIVRV